MLCVVEICKGKCCTDISRLFKDQIVREARYQSRLTINFSRNYDGGYVCCFHDNETGKCKVYDKRPLICKTFFCDSAKAGYMERASKHIKNPTFNIPLKE